MRVKIVHNPCMVRPCFLVVDREYSGSISTRKLVLETGKYNVITAYSGAEAVQILERFRAIDGAVMDTAPGDMTCEALVDALRAIKPTLPIVAVGLAGSCHCDSSVTFIESFDPARLLETIRALNPDASAEIEARNDELAAERS